MRDWKTTAWGIAILVIYVLTYFFPQHKEFLNGIVPLLIAAGFVTARDSHK
jgi:hypothetical protein